MCDTHDIAIYDISKEALIAHGKGPRSVVYSIKFNKEENSIIMACAKEVMFATFSNGKINLKKGVFGKAPILPNLCAAVLNDNMVTSMNNGLLALWKGNFCSKVYKEHTKAVGALC